jgi:hypothetical protein
MLLTLMMFDNCPVSSTYLLNTGNMSIVERSNTKKHGEPSYLIVKFMAEKSMSHMTSLTISRDLEGYNVNEVAEGSDGNGGDAKDDNASISGSGTSNVVISEAGSSELELKVRSFFAFSKSGYFILNRIIYNHLIVFLICNVFMVVPVRIHDLI